MEETKGNLDNRSEEWEDHIKKNGKIKLCVSSKTQKELQENGNGEAMFDFSLHTAFRVVENVSKKYFEEGFGTDTQETSRKHPENIQKTSRKHPENQNDPTTNN